MSAKKIAIFEVDAHEANAFEDLKRHHEVVLVPEPLRAATATEFADFAIISTFIYSELDRRALAHLPSLEMIATRSTGYDHVDTTYCNKRRIILSNVPSYGESTVAEHVFALLLSISHRMLDAVNRARSGHFSPLGLQGFDLQGKVLGVIGTGSIGRHVIRIARGFGMNVIAFDVRPVAAAAQDLGFRYTSFDQVLSTADIITLHLPATPGTQNILSSREFERMKDGIIVINTARGSLIDVRALIQALQNGKVAAAGLDVLPDEPTIREEAELICSLFCNQHDLRNVVADHILLRLPNVVITPHSAFNTREAVQRIIDTTITNITAFIEGQPQNVVAGLPADEAKSR